MHAHEPVVETDPTVGAFDPARVEAFAGRVLDVVSDAARALTLSLGHRTGLFDTMAGRAASTSEEIARAAGLQERYVREWLAGMLVSGVVEHDPLARTWMLPAEHAAVLTRSAGKDNLAKMAQFVGLMTYVEQQIAGCFREGGGVPYSAFEEFHTLMSEDSKDMAEGILLKEVVPIVEGLHDRLTRGSVVADIGCRSGHHLNVLAQAYPSSTFVGYDFSQEALDSARTVASARGLNNVRFELRDVADLNGVGPFDLVTAFDAIHDQAHPAAVLAGIAGSLTPCGIFLMVDIRASSYPHENIEVPGAPFMYGISLMHCMPVSLALDGDGLGAAWGEQTARRMLQEAGFQTVQVHDIAGDFINAYFVATLA